MNEQANLPPHPGERSLGPTRLFCRVGIEGPHPSKSAQSFGAKTSYHAFGGPRRTEECTLDLCASDWILPARRRTRCLTPRVQDENPRCRQRRAQRRCLRIPRLNLDFRPLDAPPGGFYPTAKLRLFKRGSARLSEGACPPLGRHYNSRGPRGKLKGDMLPLMAYQNRSSISST